RGPYRVAPNLMVVVPTSHRVLLHYGSTPVDYLGWAATGAGFVLVVLLALGDRRRRRPRYAYAHATGGDQAQD
ncbi:MAG: hypothetical protein ACYCS7_04985, partial [Acidimicrobiales bacterium]